MSSSLVSSSDNNNNNNNNNNNSIVLECQRLLKLYDDAVKQLRVPLADKAFYETCFVLPVRELLGLSTSEQLHHNHNNQQQIKIEKQKGCLIALRALCTHLEAHRESTLRVLQLCQHRDELVRELLHYCEHYENINNTSTNSNSSNNDVESRKPDDDIVTFFLDKLNEHHLVTLVLVESIFNWREQLTRPFSFNVSGANYIYRIMEDCAMMDTSKLGVALHLQLREYPLGSNNSSLHKTGGGRGGRSRKKVRQTSRNAHTRSSSSNNSSHTNKIGHKYTSFIPATLMQGNPSLCRRSSVTSLLREKHKLKQGERQREKVREQRDKERLIWGEAVIKGEHLLQQQLLSELMGMAEEGYFVPFIAMPDILRDSDKGLPLAEDSTEVWRKQLLTTNNNDYLMGSVVSQQQQQGTNGQSSNHTKKENGINENDNTGNGMVFSEKRPSVYSSLSVISSSTESSSSSSVIPSSPSSPSSSSLSSLSSSFVQLSSSSSAAALSPESSSEK
ncbi:uncharacterized protein TM35_000221320 [Trypanosoma theileri]|uniref:Uncharacterized protein n=1 Tax=Trypanosoma theileri TaxID=67003 RepID=A0A1X0NS79_9TRYP|nr:uncharacterized protein TM35_000221320 [Trypanosoma theileri]ORC87333.1 hypothetical protein TM35_000221320 [Trypanosoma theileri]